MSDIDDEEQAQDILAFLKPGARKTYEVAEKFALPFADARVALARLERQGRVVRLQTFGEEHPSWLYVEGL